jgi:hypothetical protein
MYERRQHEVAPRSVSVDVVGCHDLFLPDSLELSPQLAGVA